MRVSHEPSHPTSLSCALLLSRNAHPLWLSFSLLLSLACKRERSSRPCPEFQIRVFLRLPRVFAGSIRAFQPSHAVILLHKSPQPANGAWTERASRSSIFSFSQLALLAISRSSIVQTSSEPTRRTTRGFLTFTATPDAERSSPRLEIFGLRQACQLSSTRPTSCQRPQVKQSPSNGQWRAQPCRDNRG